MYIIICSFFNCSSFQTVLLNEMNCLWSNNQTKCDRISFNLLFCVVFRDAAVHCCYYDMSGGFTSVACRCCNPSSLLCAGSVCQRSRCDYRASRVPGRTAGSGRRLDVCLAAQVPLQVQHVHQRRPDPRPRRLPDRQPLQALRHGLRKEVLVFTCHPVLNAPVIIE